MEKLSVVLLLLLLVNGLFIAPVSAGADTLVLENTADAQQPDRVLNGLKNAEISPDDTLLSEFNTPAVNAMAKKNWSAAGKMYGEKMLRYPSPDTIVHYADARLLMFKEVKTRNNAIAEFNTSVVPDALLYYRSAETVDNQVNQLSADDKQHLRAKIACIEAFIADKEAKTFTCRILR
ncbi:hypothetical protein CKG00_14265 (plasmid) [Morganella morganii]|uniref:Uncharacterized protein n=1 Tax=Morganella morganii TaxID=582 RepID=A0A433ZQG1_MORMO|nr:hypothetical protein [Morganella morganii]RUT64360.1 hypothetical protein CKG00_14265 [Morganella morganii]